MGYNLGGRLSLETQAPGDLEIEGQGHKTIAFVALPIYTHTPNLKGLTKIFFKLSIRVRKEISAAAAAAAPY